MRLLWYAIAVWMSSATFALKAGSKAVEQASGRVRVSKSLWRIALGVSSRDGNTDLPTPGESGDEVRERRDARLGLGVTSR